VRRRLATLKTAADYIGCNERTIRRRIADGTLTGYRLGNRLVRVDLNELDKALHVIPTGHDGGDQHAA
jgi:excisionase family DNA binding protein